MNSKKRILVVDDEQSVTKMMALVLETRGYDVNIAGSGKEAIEKAHTNPDLILLDLILPDLEGFEVCRRLRDEKSTRSIPIIIISVKYLFEDKIEGLYLGADDYLTKPFDYEELFARIDAVLRRNLILDEFSQNRKEIIIGLRTIINEESIVSVYQPIFFLKSLKLLGVEALSRPGVEGVLANPEFLFKAALQFGLYCDLEMVAWKKAFQNLPHVHQSEKLFLNCNPYLVESPKFFKLKSLFEDYQIKPQNVILEITERSAISDFNAFYERLRFYRNYGFGIAIDDVGRGYASLESIVETKPEVVKIDNHLVRNLHDDLLKQSLIRFVVSFCRENHITSIAEGIEKKEDFDALVNLGVDAGQGYLLCRPAPDIDLAQIYKDIRFRLSLSTPL